MKQAFECKMCGHCCEGRGGIVLSPFDLARIAEHAGMAIAEFTSFYVEERNGKLVVRTGSDGFCVFFRQGEGCTVHLGRPDICRAWPFFKGNLTDPFSLQMACEDCPGITDVSFEEFRRQGLKYLREHGLLADADDNDAANALKIKK